MKGRWMENHVIARRGKLVGIVEDGMYVYADSWEGGRRRRTGPYAFTDSVRVQVEAVDLEVYPVEDERLDEAHDGLSEECVDPETYRALVKQSQHAASEHQGDECARPLDAVLDVCAGEELELCLCPRQHARNSGCPELRALHEHHDGEAEGVEGKSWPDEGLSGGFFDVDAADPKGGGEGDEQGVADHASAYHWDGVRVP